MGPIVNAAATTGLNAHNKPGQGRANEEHVGQKRADRGGAGGTIVNRERADGTPAAQEHAI